MSQLKYVLMVLSGVSLFPLAYLIFGQGDVTAVLMILPALPLLIGGLCGLSGVFDFSYLDSRTKYPNSEDELS